MIKIEKQEWKFVAWIWLIVVFLSFSPMIIGFITAFPDSVFLGRQTMNGSDLPIYYSNIQQVKEGQYLFKNLYTSETHQGFILDPFWLGVGFLAKFFSLSPFLAFQLARFLLIPIFLLVAYYFIAFFFQEEIKRKICFIFLIFASGLGGFYLETIKGVNILIDQSGTITNLPIDLWVPEAFTFLSIHNSPHFIASLTLIMLIFLFSLLAFANYKIIYSLGAGLSALFLFQFHPYHLPTIFGPLFVFIIYCLIKPVRNFNYLKHFLILLIFSLPPVFYHLWTIENIWVRKQHFLQAITLTPSLSMVLIGYGLLFPLALIGGFSIFQKKEMVKKEIFLVCWALIQFLLLYFPMSSQRRLSEGLQIPITILAILGLFYLKNWIKEKIIPQKYLFLKNIFSNKFFLIYIFFILFFISNLTILVSDLSLYLKKQPGIYLAKEEIEAMKWLKQNTAQDSIILSTLSMGNLIPAFTLRQVYLGHGHQTAHFQEKWERTNWFFKTNSDKEKISFLRENRINYLYFSQPEKELAKFNPDEKSFLEKVYGNPQVAIYKIKFAKENNL